MRAAFDASRANRVADSRVVHQRRVHHLDRALAIHLHVLGDVHAAHAAFAESREDQIAVGDHAADQRVAAALRAKRRAVLRTEAVAGLVFAAALRAHLGDRDRALRPLASAVARASPSRCWPCSIGGRRLVGPTTRSPRRLGVAGVGYGLIADWTCRQWRLRQEHAPSDFGHTRTGCRRWYDYGSRSPPQPRHPPDDDSRMVPFLPGMSAAMGPRTADN